MVLERIYDLGTLVERLSLDHLGALDGLSFDLGISGEQIGISLKLGLFMQKRRFALDELGILEVSLELGVLEISVYCLGLLSELRSLVSLSVL